MLVNQRNIEKINKFFDGYMDLFHPFANKINSDTLLNVEDFLSTDIDEIIYAIAIRQSSLLKSYEIPIFSSFEDCTIGICEVLDTVSSNELSYVELGKMLQQKRAKKMTEYKYGETHFKAAKLLGLVVNAKKQGAAKTQLTNIGYYYLTHKDKREIILTRLLLKSKIVQTLVKESYLKEIQASEFMSVLSKKSINRRLPNVKKFMTTLYESKEYDFTYIQNRISYDYLEIE